MRQEIFDYLDKLRKNGKEDMFKAPAMIANKFKINKTIARSIVSQWVAEKENFYKGE
jgi:hypothetical protein